MVMPIEDLRKHTTLNGFEVLPLTFEHTVKLVNLELHHRDPFDRIIIFQALVERITLISKDENFKKYDNLQLLW
jgi:PIN domain nuclease of toxin-antitoxin system